MCELSCDSSLPGGKGQLRGDAGAREPIDLMACMFLVKDSNSAGLYGKAPIERSPAGEGPAGDERNGCPSAVAGVYRRRASVAGWEAR